MAFSAAGNSGPLADINVTPLVDVMLVLLIIFIVTAPMVSLPIPVNLPQRTTTPPDTPPQPIELRVDASNQVSWNGQKVAVASLQQRMQDAAQANTGNVPELRIATDPNAEYDVMAKVLAAANNAHMKKIAFVNP
ncbi:biopolymer transporter ExbD [Stenotrophomonas sp. ISL-67]|uniref:ExbD/TolR family protein n=1 Tax=Stenotrophomonas sp. ISL-67 TaxID=2819171 RepID=UPI001BE67D18|nr:biopolymer transporter ExbD [Stenotrophomonas sp. ISL-67]MBT2766954.1 biopolymer transporter ExbD [Stenotrophomonas sp. ISL-67]